MINDEEREWQQEQQARLEQARRDSDPALVKSFLDSYTNRFLVDLRRSFVQLIQGPGTVAWSTYPGKIDLDGVSVRQWSFSGPSKLSEHRHKELAHEIDAGVGTEKLLLAGGLQRQINAGSLALVDVPAEVIDKVGGLDTIVKTGVMPPELLPILWQPIQQRINTDFDNEWETRLVSYEDVLLLPDGQVKVTIKRDDFIEARASEAEEGVLYFVTVTGTKADGTPINIKAVEKTIKTEGMKENVEKHATGSPFPDDVKRKHALLVENKVPTFDWLLINEGNTRILTPDLTESGGREVLDSNVYFYHVHPEQNLNQKVVRPPIPQWAKEYSPKIDSRLEELKEKLEQLGFEVIKDSYFIIQALGDEKEPKVIVGDLGLGLLPPDDPNKGQVNKRFTL